ncbi:MAG: Two-component response regulator [uncultured bacterium]|nr:MAG: Two-component response regulator [uncultured bacterium]
MNKYKILIADDEESIRTIIVRYFQNKGLTVFSVTNGKEAVIAEEEIRPDLIILDVEMPVMNGFEACKIIKEKRQGINYIPIIFLSGSLTEKIVITGLELGADDYVRKPFEPLELLTRVKNFLKMKDFITQVELIDNMFLSLLKSIEARDFYTSKHSFNVSNYSMRIGKELNLSKNEIDILCKGSLLHDIGKIGISDMVLNKPGGLTDAEFNLIKEHSVKGEEICKFIRLDSQILEMIRFHHEKLDGSGYPDGLEGKEIGLLIRIVTVADIYDALTTNRPYRASKTNEQALSILKQEAKEGKLDISIVECMEKIGL